MKRLETVRVHIDDVNTLWAFFEMEYKHEERMQQLDYGCNDDKEMRKLEEEFTRAVDMK